MFYLVTADLVLLLHFGFVLFALLGGLLALKWEKAAWLHLPAVAWGSFVEFSGWICPLTPLENWLRAQAGESTYAGDFLVRYLSTILYPDVLTRDLQVAFGTAVVVINLAIYGRLWRTRQREG